MIRLKPFKIKIPDSFLEGVIPSVYECPNRLQFHIELRDEKDKDVIDWLLTCKDGYRNNMIKNLTRNFLEIPLFAFYLSNSKDVLDTLTDSFLLFKNSKEEISIKEFSKKKDRKNDHNEINKQEKIKETKIEDSKYHAGFAKSESKQEMKINKEEI